MSDFRDYVLRNETNGTYYRMSKNMWTEDKSCLLYTSKQRNFVELIYITGENGISWTRIISTITM